MLRAYLHMDGMLGWLYVGWLGVQYVSYSLVFSYGYNDLFFYSSIIIASKITCESLTPFNLTCFACILGMFLLLKATWRYSVYIPHDLVYCRLLLKDNV